MNYPRVERIRRCGRAALVATIIGAAMYAGNYIRASRYGCAIVCLLVAAGAGGYVLMRLWYQ